MKKIILLSMSIALLAACTSEIKPSGSNSNPDINVPTGNKSVDQLLEDATQSLENDEWDEAIAYYNAAYEKDNDDVKAVIYSTLANIAKISTDPKVAALIKNNFGFTEYPGTLNALFSDNWMKNTPYIEWDYYDQASGRHAEWYRKGEYSWCSDDIVNVAGYYSCTWRSGDYVFELVSTTAKTRDERLPNVKTPSWVKGSGSLYDSFLINNAFSVDNWALSIIANVLDRNSNGFNNTLDEVIDGVFGVSYNEAVERLKKLENRKEERIKLDPSFIEKFELEEIFDEHDGIGWAEVNVVLSAMLAIKASLEWVQTYDLNTDLNWLKFAWSADEDKLEQDILNKFKSLPANQIPFNNNFLKVRTGKSMATSKATYEAAIRGLQASYTSIQNSNLYPSEVKDAYPAINDGFNKLIAAINNGGKFYIPKNAPTEINSWPTTSNDAQAIIDLGKVFTPGYFSLQNLLEAEGGKPVFYSRYEVCDEYDWDCDYIYVKLDKNSYKLALSNGRLTLRINVNHITSIVDKVPTDEFEYIRLDVSEEAAEAIFEKYYP